MNYYSPMVEPATPAGDFNASGYGHEDALGRPYDCGETQSTFPDSDLASETGDQR